MAFENLPLAARAARRPKKVTVFCVGRRAFVHWPDGTGVAVPAMDRSGNLRENDLCDGEEVEILSWQPGSSRGLLYQVQRVADGGEWWLADGHLRCARRTSPAASNGRDGG